MAEEKKSFGYHLMLDLYDCKKETVDDLSLCYRFLDELVGDIGAEKQSAPFIFRSDEKKYPDKAGLSGWVPLIESGASIHTLTPTNFISIDVYSCRKFDLEIIRKKAREFFKPKEIEERFVLRGKKYYQKYKRFFEEK